jgi:hypothetical protein
VAGYTKLGEIILRNGERDSARGGKLCQEVYSFKFDIQPVVAKMNPASSLA